MSKDWIDTKRPILAPTVVRRDEAVVDTTEKHPAYGQISAGRVSGKTYLYGSDFSHQHFIRIEIRRSELNRSLSRDWASGRDELIEVWLSEAQWATFVSSLNVGMGVQCTLKYIQGQPEIPGLPRPVRRAVQFAGELKKQFADALGFLGQLKERLKSGKAGKEAVTLVERAEMEITSGAPWVAQSFEEHVEEVTEAAKTEVNAYIQGTIARAGLEALGGKPPLALEE